MDITLGKIVLITMVVELIAKEYKLNINEARDLFYKSNTIKLLNDKETGLYGQSPQYILSIYKRKK